MSASLVVNVARVASAVLVHRAPLKNAGTFGAGVAVGMLVASPVATLSGVVVGSVGTLLISAHIKKNT
ncbi:MAG: hypothetical protein E6R03_13520 [Hyphomicrobiaceae bacterium]|nr:MAG: hypothetical protein E6R03_13520 [Hyphomicrobiaceae bacterium]